MRIAYFINQYPKVSHSFIRREILELENQGVEVVRFAIRRDESGLVDQQDLDELPRMHYLTERGGWNILRSVLMLLLTSPVAFLRTLFMAITMGRRSYVGVIKHLFYFIEACVLGAWVNEFEVKHIHAHFGSNPAAIVLLVNLLYKISYSFTVHGPGEFDKPEALSLGLKIEHAAFVIAISSFGRSQLFRWCSHEHWSKIHIVHCALGLDFIESKVTHLPESNRLVCVGRLCEQKGQILLLEAVRRIKDAGMPIELTLAGDGPMRSEIEALIRQYNLSSEVRITGWISSSQVRDEIVASKALVLPSFAEGLPVVLMEASALHRPSITTYIAGIPELIHHGVNGLLVSAGSIDALTSALEVLLKMPLGELNKMGDNAYDLVCKNHDIRIEGGKLKFLFFDVMKSS